MSGGSKSRIPITPLSLSVPDPIIPFLSAVFNDLQSHRVVEYFSIVQIPLLSMGGNQG